MIVEVKTLSYTLYYNICYNSIRMTCKIETLQTIKKMMNIYDEHIAKENKMK